jgi:hypothetical protein
MMEELQLDLKTKVRKNINQVEVQQVNDDGEIQKVVLFNFEIEKINELFKSKNY